jgi:hypothetical protein
MWKQGAERNQARFGDRRWSRPRAEQLIPRHREDDPSEQMIDARRVTRIPEHSVVLDSTSMVSRSPTADARPPAGQPASVLGPARVGQRSMAYVRRHASVSVASVPGPVFRAVFLVACGMATPLRHSYGRRIGVTVRTLHGSAARAHLAVAVTTLSRARGGRPPRSRSHLCVRCARP